MSIVAVERVWKFYGDFPAVQDVSFVVEPGQSVALLGRNGAGKTTLLRMLAGLAKASRGRIQKPEAPRIGMLGHGIGIYDELTAEENLRLFAALFGLDDPAGIADQWLRHIGLEKVRNGRVREFSRGMRQRLAIARAFLHKPSLLLLDEPFTSLDDRAIALLQDLLREVLAEGTTVLMSTHQLREALEMATHVVLVSRGRVAHAGPRTAQMLEDPGFLYRTYGDA